MSIFANSTFILSVKYRYNRDISGNVSGVHILPDNAVGEDVHELFCEAKRDESGVMYQIEEEASVINHVTGATMIRKAVLVPSILNSFFVDWNMVEDQPDTDKPREIPFSRESLSRLPTNLRTALALRWLRMSF